MWLRVLTYRVYSQVQGLRSAWKQACPIGSLFLLGFCLADFFLKQQVPGPALMHTYTPRYIDMYVYTRIQTHTYIYYIYIYIYIHTYICACVCVCGVGVCTYRQRERKRERERGRERERDIYIYICV